MMDQRAPRPSGDTIKVGILHSLSGTMAISEVTVKNSELHGDRRDQRRRRRARQEDRAGHRGRRLRLADLRREGAEADLRSTRSRRSSAAGPRPAARRCCRSSRSNKALLCYPVQYEGLEASPYIFYTGATTNQQIIPASTTSRRRARRRSSCVGSDYVFPRTANKEIKAYAAANGMEIVGEEYTPLGDTEFGTIDQQDQGGQARRGLQHAQRRQQRRVLQAARRPA